MKYTVIFTQYHHYEVDADNENKAYNRAYNEFIADMKSPIANTNYDEVDIYSEEDDE